MLASASVFEARQVEFVKASGIGEDVDLGDHLVGAKAFGPKLFFPHDIPRTKLEPFAEESELPGGLRGVFNGGAEYETPVWCPEQRTAVFADALTAPESDGMLRVWDTPWHERRVLPALRELLELPFEKVIASHGGRHPRSRCV